MRRIRLVAGLLAAATLGGCGPPRITADLVIHGVTVYDGAGAPPFVATIAVTDGVFSRIDRDGTARFETPNRIDGRGAYLLPGLWDMHVHLASGESGVIDTAAFLRAGITSVRDLGGLPRRVGAIRAAIAAARQPGPTVYWVGPTLNGEAFADFQRLVETRADVEAAIDELAAAGVDMIKVHRAFDPALLPDLVEAAHARGLAVTGHIPLGTHPLQACRIGLDGVEHVGSFIEALVSVAAPEQASVEAAIALMESDAAAEIYGCFAERGVFVTPTLVVYPAVARSRGLDESTPAEVGEFIAAMQRIALRFHRRGVRLLAGTDTASDEPLAIAPGESLHAELALLQEAGIAPADLIVIASSNAACALGACAETGSITVGKAADFILVAEDPGSDIRHLAAPRAVYRAGAEIARGGD